MAVIELILPQLINDPKVVEDVVHNVLPTSLFPRLRTAGVSHGLQGSIRSEDGKDVKSDLRLALLMGWPAASNFYNFLESPGYAQFKGDLKPFASGPAILKLFETNSGLSEILNNSVLEILIIDPKDTGESALNTAKENIAAQAKKTNGLFQIHGSSLNLERKQFVVIGSHKNRSGFDATTNYSSRGEFLRAVREISEVTQLVVDVQNVPF